MCCQHVWVHFCAKWYCCCSDLYMANTNICCTMLYRAISLVQSLFGSFFCVMTILHENKHVYCSYILLSCSKNVGFSFHEQSGILRLGSLIITYFDLTFIESNAANKCLICWIIFTCLEQTSTITTSIFGSIQLD